MSCLDSSAAASVTFHPLVSSEENNVCAPGLTGRPLSAYLRQSPSLYIEASGCTVLALWGRLCKERPNTGVKNAHRFQISLVVRKSFLFIFLSPACSGHANCHLKQVQADANLPCFTSCGNLLYPVLFKWLTFLWPGFHQCKLIAGPLCLPNKQGSLCLYNERPRCCCTLRSMLIQSAETNVCACMRALNTHLICPDPSFVEPIIVCAFVQG